MRQLCLGEYTLVLDGGRVAICGPDEVTCRQAEDRLVELIGTADGAKIYTRTMTEFEGMCVALVFDGALDDSEIC